MDKQPAVSMEEYWKGLEDKTEVVDKTNTREKRDIGDVLERIRESIAIKAREAHRLDKEYVDDK